MCASRALLERHLPISRSYWCATLVTPLPGPLSVLPCWHTALSFLPISPHFCCPGFLCQHLYRIPLFENLIPFIRHEPDKCWHKISMGFLQKFPTHLLCFFPIFLQEWTQRECLFLWLVSLSNPCLMKDLGQTVWCHFKSAVKSKPFRPIVAPNCSPVVLHLVRDVAFAQPLILDAMGLPITAVTKMFFHLWIYIYLSWQSRTQPQTQTFATLFVFVSFFTSWNA